MTFAADPVVARAALGGDTGTLAGAVRRAIGRRARRLGAAPSATLATGSASAVLLLAVAVGFSAGEPVADRGVHWQLRGTLAPPSPAAAGIGRPSEAGTSQPPSVLPDGWSAGLHRRTKTV